MRILKRIHKIVTFGGFQSPEERKKKKSKNRQIYIYMRVVVIV
jgi:hypothetical protein